MGAYCLRAVEELPHDEASSEIFSVPFTATPEEGRREASRVEERWRNSREPLLHGEDAEEEQGQLSQRKGRAEAWPLGAGKKDQASPAVRWSRMPQVPVPVTLHIYDIGTSGGGHVINRLLRPLGTGVFHCGVEVFGCEWSYSDTTSGVGDGVFCSRPRCCEGHTYCESVSMGRTATTESEVLQLIEMLKKDWPVYAYDVLVHNCCHFSDEFCQRLGVGAIPTWVMNLAGAGAAVAAAGDTTCCRQVATQVALHTCCPQPPRRAGYMPVEVIDTPKQESRRSRKVAATEA